VHSEKGYFFIAGEDRRIRLTTKRVLDSWAPQRVIETTESALAGYRVSSKMKFRNGSLIYSMADGKLYFISDGKRRLVTSPEAAERIGAPGGRRDAVCVSEAEILLHPEGEPLD